MSIDESDSMCPQELAASKAKSMLAEQRAQTLESELTAVKAVRFLLSPLFVNLQ